MDKRKYMKPNCEAVAVNCSDSFLEFTSIVSVGGMAKQDKEALIIRRRDALESVEVDPWSWDCVLWGQEVNEFEDE